MTKLELIKKQIKQSDKLFEEALEFGYIFSKPKPPKINWFGEIEGKNHDL